MSYKSIVDKCSKFWHKHGNDICLYFGTASLLSAGVASAYGTVKAVRKCDEMTAEKGEPLTKKEVVKGTYKYFLPAVASAAVGATCVLTAHAKNNTKNAALATAYALSDSRYRHFKDEVMHQVGKKKAEEINSEAKRKTVLENKDAPIIESTLGKGTTKCYDYFMGRYFWSDIDKIEKAMVEFNRQLMNEESLSLNDFYNILDLPYSKGASQIGWEIDDIQKGQIEIDKSSCLDSEGTPCLIVDFNIQPHSSKYGFV